MSCRPVTKRRRGAHAATAGGRVSQSVRPRGVYVFRRIWDFKQKMSRHEGTYVLRTSKSARGTGDRAKITRTRRRDERFLGHVGHAGSFAVGPRGPATVPVGPSAVWMFFWHGTRPASSRGRWGLMSEARWQHTVKIYVNFWRICDVFPKNPWGSATIFDSLLLWHAVRSSTTTSDQLSDRRTTSADSPFNTVPQAPNPFFLSSLSSQNILQPFSNIIVVSLHETSCTDSR